MDAHKGLPYYMTFLWATPTMYMYSRVAPCGRPLCSHVISFVFPRYFISLHNQTRTALSQSDNIFDIAHGSLGEWAYCIGSLLENAFQCW